jgi:hypothetical protein
MMIIACYGAIPYPINFHGYDDDSRIYCFDTDINGNLVYGGYTFDNGITDVYASSWYTTAFITY